MIWVGHNCPAPTSPAQWVSGLMKRLLPITQPSLRSLSRVCAASPSIRPGRGLLLDVAARAAPAPVHGAPAGDPLGHAHGRFLGAQVDARALVRERGMAAGVRRDVVAEPVSGPDARGQAAVQVAP